MKAKSEMGESNQCGYTFGSSVTVTRKIEYAVVGMEIHDAIH